MTDLLTFLWHTGVLVLAGLAAIGLALVVLRWVGWR